MENKTYTGMTDGDLSALEDTIEIMKDLCNKWMSDEDVKLYRAALKINALTTLIGNLLKQKIGGTLELIYEKEKLGYID